MKFLFIEPFFGGSHKSFASGLIEHSRHKIDLVTLPAYFWKWRMRGAAVYFYEKIRDFSSYDGIITTDMINLTDLVALGGPSMPPCLVYFHENQLTYPLAPGNAMDYQFGFTNITTALVARQLLFNSRTQLQAFLSAISKLMKKMPDARIGWVRNRIEAKAGVIYPGCSFPAGRCDLKAKHKLEARCELDVKCEPDVKCESDVKHELNAECNPKDVSNSAPLIIWNHRWEFDKQPDVFFNALKAIKQKGIPFRLALLGESCQDVPAIFNNCCRYFKEEIVVSGYVKSRSDYENWLRKGAIVVSTAIQENFGISVVEAVRFGALPLLPDSLSYPEIIPQKFHGDLLYSSFDDLVVKLGGMLKEYGGFDIAYGGSETACGRFDTMRSQLSIAMEKYSWEVVISDYDILLDELGGLNRHG